ncbi:uncharacterized protein PFL1_03145 [Pseudozyma flocculosa PF-1]|uniref:CP-type G domain-containing protein n=1 Tax=Pseudozyma flocculosa PF-1 TaxID=1277687 RepID=A0A061HBI0_9BASI|nr:uncharacterized protein PFL1_03145 [Pseudozyma flocculosa PF-1]EPQ29390.1 hypothetical protein PFL1_03145 [Pseudozyma flocculosa PF-1]
MGRNSRKEDRQSRKRTKIGLDQTKASGQKSSNAAFAPPVFAKGQFASLANKGKARSNKQATTATNGGSNASDIVEADMAEDDALASPASSPATRVSNASLNRHGIQSVDHADVGILEDANPALQSAWDDFGAKARLDDTLTGRRDSSLKAYMKELRKLVENADVLLEVLDARDPMGCRSLETERMLMRAGKKVVLILNKIDLVPKSNVEAWLRYLRHDFPTLAFKASTQSQRSNLSQGAAAFYSGGGGGSGKASSSSGSASAGKDVITGGAEAMGAGALLQLIKNYSRNLNLKTSITVGIFGAPNVGKSSLINSLKRARVCSVASTPGHTKVVQGVMLDKSVRLLDCPGIVFSDETGGATSGLSAEEIVMRKQSALLRNVVKVELVEDPVTPVEAIMARVEDQELADVYGLEFFQSGDAQDFLMRLAIQRGRMLRGGKIDIEGTARTVLHDWNVGRIKYFTQPPALHRSAILSADNGRQAAGNAHAATSAADAAVAAMEDGDQESERAKQQLAESTTIVSGFSEAFDLAGLLGEADAEIFGTGTGTSTAAVPEPPKARFATQEELAAADGQGAEDAAAEEIVDDHGGAVGDVSNVSTLGKRRRAFDDEGGADDSESDDDDDDEDGDDEQGMRRRRPVRRTAPGNVPGLSQMDDDGDDDDDLVSAGQAVAEDGARGRSGNAGAPSAAFTFQASPTAAGQAGGPAWLDRQQAKAAAASGRSKRNEELSTMFSSQELEGLAASRGSQNRKMKKMKKKAERAGAGLVGALEASMDLGTVVGNGAAQSKKKQNGANGQRAKPQQRGRFAALMQDGDEDDDDDDDDDDDEANGAGMRDERAAGSLVVVEEEVDMGAAPAAAHSATPAVVAATIEEDEEEL